MKVGDFVEIVTMEEDDGYGCIGEYYNVGDRGIVTQDDEDGTVWVDFAANSDCIYTINRTYSGSCTTWCVCAEECKVI